MATDKQRNQFFALWGRAKAEVCERYDLCSLVRDQERTARHRWIRECTSRTEDINAVRPGNEFSKLMLQTAIAAGDYREAAYWEMDVSKRWKFFMEQLIRQLGEITRQARAWEYVQGIFSHLRLPTRWQDIPEGELEKVWQMLDSHRRRILKREHGWEGLRKSDMNPLGFFPEVEYVYDGAGQLGMRWPDKRTAREEHVEICEEVTA